MAVQLAKFTGTTHSFELKVRELKEALRKRMIERVERAAQVWLNATVLSIIPVWSGASHGTFLKLARAVSFTLTIQPEVNTGGFALGIAAGKAASQGKLKKKLPIVSFVYETDLWHLVYNEQNNANLNPAAGRLFAKLKRPGPYNFRTVGAAAFREFCKESFPFPNPWGYKRRKSRSIG